MLNFPPWTTTIRAFLPPLGAGGLLYVITLVWYGGSPLTTDVGYEPVQPVPYSHALHAGTLGINCLYCHTNVDKAAHANVPATETCMNCHQRIKAKSPQLAAVRESWSTGNPVEWVKVHDLPDFAYFNHSAHIKKGVGCVSCHGRIDTMEKVSQREKLSMGWCLECHRAPEKNLRPPEMVTVMDWKAPEDPQTYGARLKEKNHINPPVHCSGCHR